MPTERMSVGVGYQSHDDDFPDAEYGYQSGEDSTISLNLSYATEEGLTLFAYADFSEWDMETSLRAKCSNRWVPPGSPPWNVPNFDWLSTSKDETTAFGGGITWQGKSRTAVDLLVNYVDGSVVQTTRNPGTPVELDPANPVVGQTAFVALGLDVPGQGNTPLSSELRVTRDQRALFRRFHVTLRELRPRRFPVGREDCVRSGLSLRG